MHQSVFITQWVVGIKSRMASMCEEGFVTSIITLFYNDAASENILESKRKLRLERAAIQQQHQMLTLIPWYCIGERLIKYLKIWRNRLAVRFDVWRYEPSEDAINRCLVSPEFEFMKYLHKLTERMASWRAFSNKKPPLEELPEEFIEVKGAMDPPHAEYEHLCRIQEMTDAFIPAAMQRTLFVMMLSEKMGQTRLLTPSHTE